MGLLTEAEIKYIDFTVSKEEVLKAIKNTIRTNAAGREAKVATLDNALIPQFGLPDSDGKIVQMAA